ncbi:hypothetical protein [Sinorhizobium fredii]|uniref:hypothetical protein n=1 Tax=Rhizobium fredii TaxID=380 RepID=UPI0011D2B2DC|nr:hypothetical protein [Sinorhizobium fredii]WOS66204.1 hypothetical protein SFGR64A_21205 [Sinorhizobium fredii GR64]
MSAIFDLRHIEVRLIHLNEIGRQLLQAIEAPGEEIVDENYDGLDERESGAIGIDHCVIGNRNEKAGYRSLPASSKQFFDPPTIISTHAMCAVAIVNCLAIPVAQTVKLHFKFEPSGKYRET